MAWLDLIDSRETRRLTRNLQRGAGQTRELAQEHFGQFAQQAGKIASHAARELADYGQHRSAELAHYGRHEGADLARDTVRHYAERAQHMRQQAQPYIDQGLAEGAVLAHQAARSAARVGRAVKADPVPAVVGVIGLALLVSLLRNRRSRLD